MLDSLAQPERNRNERRQIGKSLRQNAPLREHGEWTATTDRRDPLELIRQRDTGRLEAFLPVKYERMASSPFAFFRGSAALMASDLARTPLSGIDAVLCGDAHLSNFGIYATSERKLVFDLNDFDEAYRGPWEWDVKRLSASAVIAGRQRGFDEIVNLEIATYVGQAYREAVQRFSKLSLLDLWYYHVEVDELLSVLTSYSKRAARHALKAIGAAQRQRRDAAVVNLTEVVGGRRQFVNNPPFQVRLSNVTTADGQRQVQESDIEQAWQGYLQSLPEERQVLLSRFQLVDAAQKVGGIGSVGTRCAIALLESGSGEDAVIVQQKEAGASALEAYLPERENRIYANPAHRVVVAQRLIQAASDIFLGWHHFESTDRYFYWRQLGDLQAEIDVEDLDARGLRAYLAACAMCLARAHSRTGDPSAMAGYLGTNPTFDVALGRFAVAYADQTERDHQALALAVKSGRMASP